MFLNFFGSPSPHFKRNSVFVIMWWLHIFPIWKLQIESDMSTPTGRAEQTIKRMWVRLFLVINSFYTGEVALSIL